MGFQMDWYYKILDISIYSKNLQFACTETLALECAYQVSPIPRSRTRNTKSSFVDVKLLI